MGLPKTKLRKVVAYCLTFVLLFTGLQAIEIVNYSSEKANAADLSQFDAGNIISDSKFFDGNAMSAAAVQNFLNSKVPNCTINNGDPSHAAGAPYYSRSGAIFSYVAPHCLKNYVQDTPNMAAQPGFCSAYSGGSLETAAQIITKIGQACNISQKVLLVLLEKEQSLVRDTWPLVKQFDSATGFACYDNGQPCVSGYAGFFFQVWAAARQFQRYGTSPFTWYPVNQLSYILYQANNPGCGTKPVWIKNRATAALYYYTPYAPNQAALDAGYGTGDECSAYGNRNFYQLYVDWFGSTQGSNVLLNLSSTPTPTMAPVSSQIVGTTFSAAANGWDSGALVSFQWTRNGQEIPGATSSTYTSTVSDVGYSIQVKAIGTRAGYNTATVASFDSAQIFNNSAELNATSNVMKSIVPIRLADTRTGMPSVDGQYTGTGKIGPGQTLRLPVLGRGTIPASGVGAVSLNVTAVDPTGGSWLTVFPTGDTRPVTSNLNFGAGQTIPNSVISKIGSDGSVSIFNALGSTDIIVDINGWWPTTSSFTPITPIRLTDTRTGMPSVDGQYTGTGKIGPGQTLRLPVLGRGTIPASGVGAVSLNVTAVDPTGGSWLTVFPTGSTRPITSNLNFGPGQTTPNSVITKVGADGSVSIFNALGSTDIIVDINGWWPTTDKFTPITPIRLTDTRTGMPSVDGQYTGTGKIGPGQSLRLPVLGRGTIPASGVGAVSLNVTAVDPTGGSWLTVFPTGSTRPITSNLNFGPGQTIPNSVITKVGADGSVSIFNALGSTDIIVDINGWFPLRG